MAANPHILPKKLPSVPSRWKPQPRGVPQPGQPPVEEAKAVGSELWARLSSWLAMPSLILILGCCLTAVAGLVACLQRWISPEYIVTVQQFEIAPEVASRLGMTGKGASDVVIDTLNGTAVDGSRFQGAEYYAYDHHGTQPVALNQGIRVPVESSYGIEVKGISVDSIVKLYQRVRCNQWIISGDVLPTGDGFLVRIRLNRDDAPQSWQAVLPAHADPARLIQEVAGLMLTEVNPELLGRAYLTQEKYAEAADVFRQWALRTPHDWRPPYYLSLAMDYQDKEPEASSLAQWSRNVAMHEKATPDVKHTDTPAANAETAENLARVTEAVWATRGEPALNTLSSAEKLKELSRLKGAEQTLRSLCARDPNTLTYEIQLARILDREAAVEASVSPVYSEAFVTEGKAIVLLEAAVAKMPANGGLHEQHAVLLQHMVAMEKAAGRDPRGIAARETEEVAEFTRALELRPTQASPLWAALYGLLDLKREEDAVHLTRAASLLQPESTAAKAAYVVALEHAMKSRGGDAERETEVADRLKPLLLTASDVELQAIWYSCVDRGDTQRLMELAEAARQRFPEDRTFGDGVESRAD